MRSSLEVADVALFKHSAVEVIKVGAAVPAGVVDVCVAVWRLKALALKFLALAHDAPAAAYYFQQP
jgi:hypothetical protein